MPEASHDTLEVAATTGAAHALIAIATARAAGAAMVEDDGGAEWLWDYAPQSPYTAETAEGREQYDAYLSAWIEVAQMLIEHKEGGMRLTLNAPWVSGDSKWCMEVVA